MNFDEMNMQQKLALLTFRTSVAEAALVEAFNALEPVRQALAGVVQQVQEVNTRFPLGDTTEEGMRALILKAIRASSPGVQGKTDAEILAMLTKT
jgi:hypothetical protein